MLCRRVFTGLCGTSDFEIGWGYVKQAESVVMTAGVVGCAIWPCSGVVDEEMVMSQQSVRQAARRSALDAQAVLRKARAGRVAGLRVWRWLY
jgi:hypothetical protein